jgi:6,7-dimethyl-8-ribityllumazine synthase
MAEVTNSKLLKTDTGIPKKDACIVLVKTEWNAAMLMNWKKDAGRS